MSVAVLIPAYNEAATIARVVHDVSFAGSVIVIDDASTDGTGDLARSEGAVVVVHLINRGYDAALQSGFEKAVELGIQVVVTFDADGQHEPTILNQFLAPLVSGEVHLVLGVRGESARVAESLFNLYGRLRFGVPDLLCGLKGYRMSVYFDNGRFDGTGSIGTELALAGLRRRVPTITVPVPINTRDGVPRFGTFFRANCKILRALMFALFSDFRESFS